MLSSGSTSSARRIRPRRTGRASSALDSASSFMLASSSESVDFLAFALTPGGSKNASASLVYSLRTNKDKLMPCLCAVYSPREQRKKQRKEDKFSPKIRLDELFLEGTCMYISSATTLASLILISSLICSDENLLVCICGCRKGGAFSLGIFGKEVSPSPDLFDRSSNKDAFAMLRPAWPRSWRW